jgi:hypothetical protein
MMYELKVVSLNGSSGSQILIWILDEISLSDYQTWFSEVYSARWQMPFTLILSFQTMDPVQPLIDYLQMQSGGITFGPIAWSLSSQPGDMLLRTGEITLPGSSSI